MSDGTVPRVSVIMPCFNHGKYIYESALSILNQTFTNIELIIVDDGSRDDSAQFIEKLSQLDNRVKCLIHPTNQGASCARNDGIEASGGEFLAFCDADDLWLPTKVEKQVALLEARPSVGLAYCDSGIIDQSGELTGQFFSDIYPLPPTPSGALFAKLCVDNFINMQTVMVRRDILPTLRCFDEHVRWVEDWWLWVQLSRRTLFFYDQSPLARYRIHPHSTYLSQPMGVIRNRFKVMKRNLQTHPDLSFDLQGNLWYSIGRQLHLMGRVKMGRRCMTRGFERAIRGGSSVKRTFIMAARLLQSILMH